MKTKYTLLFILILIVGCKDAKDKNIYNDTLVNISVKHDTFSKSTFRNLGDTVIFDTVLRSFNNKAGYVIVIKPQKYPYIDTIQNDTEYIPLTFDSNLFVRRITITTKTYTKK